MNLTSKVKATAEKIPASIAYSFMGKKVSYARFVSQIDRASYALEKLGVKKGDVVCIAMPNMPQAIIALYAINQIGAITHMIHPLSSENEFSFFINRVHSKYLFILDSFYPKVKAIMNSTPLEKVVVTNIKEALPCFKKAAYSLLNAKNEIKIEEDDRTISWKNFFALGKKENYSTEYDNDEDIALILHSGGTTGKIKGVCLSNGSVNEATRQMLKFNPALKPHDKFLTVMPIFHGNGLVIGVHSMMAIGARSVLIPRFTPESYAKDLVKNKCNFISGVPSLYGRLIETKTLQKADLSFLKGVFCGADYLSEDLERKIDAFLKAHHCPVSVQQGYGMTEGVVSCLENTANPKLGSIGIPFDGVKARIVDPTTYQELPRNQIGEIIFSSKTNMLGYFEDEEETKLVKKFHDGIEWIHSGDLGLEDEDGYFFFKGRIKRMIVQNGYNIFPNDLEATISTFPMVKECCVIGVPVKEGYNIIKAFIILKDGFEKNDATKEEIFALCKKNIVKYAMVKQIEFVDSIPKTKIGKVDFKKLSN